MAKAKKVLKPLKTDQAVLDKMVEEAKTKLGLKEVHNEQTSRLSFSQVGDLIDIPSLLQVQKDSYQDFLDRGIKEVFDTISPITDYTGNLILEFFGYRLDDETKYTLEETRERALTYSKRLYADVRLINRETGEIKEQSIFMGDIPMMTDAATFVINGAERVIVSQLIRSPGCYFVPVVPAGKNKNVKLYNATIMPITGAWIELETEPQGGMFTRIDRTRKIPSTILLKALGLSDPKDMIELFGEEEMLIKTLEKDNIETQDEALIEIYKKIRPGELPTIDSAKTMFSTLFFNTRRYTISNVGRFKYNKKLGLENRIARLPLAEKIVDPETGEILHEAGEKLTPEEARTVQNKGVNRVVVKFNGKDVVVLGNTTVDAAEYIGEELKAKLGIKENVGYYKLKEILKDVEENGLDLEAELIKNFEELTLQTVTREDIFATFNYLINLDHGMYKVDNIDHLGNRRIRSVGELTQNDFRKGLLRVERTVKERMTVQDLDSITPQTLINVKPITAALKEFFSSSQLSQMIEQTNSLSELTNKRKISALGQGGLSRERASFEVRDVHYTHYGRLCPIESPEGPNVGLILFLALFARINDYGFLETPYRRIDQKTGKVTDDVVYMSADVEDNHVITTAIEPLTKDGKLRKKRVRARYYDEIKEVDSKEIEYMDISPKQISAIAPAMIPFLENDDGKRALMGANMQRQAVPLIKTDSPIVGTGMEYRAAKDSGTVVVAKEAGKVTKVTADYITIESGRGKNKTSLDYHLRKLKKTNNSTSINQKPIVEEGQKVEAGEIIADGMSTDKGEMALGKNVIVAFANWEGYNFEDAILISEELVENDDYTSIHIKDYQCESKETKLGVEEITREIPNVGEDALKDLDEDGIICVGAVVNPGDILVGKITPKGETESTPEEKLLKAIFGEKSREVRDTSLRVGNGQQGTVVDVKRYKRENYDEMKTGVNEVIKVYIAQKRKLIVGDKMAGRHGNKGIISRILPKEDMPYLPDGTPVQIVLNPLGVPSRMNLGQLLEIHLGEVGRRMNVKFSTPVFDGATNPDIEELLKITGASPDGKTVLYNGRTGEPFDNPVAVGIMYMLKLHHLVQDKIHARSTGPYSLVTKQPLSGKAQRGGQRLGEMEVWALQGYGAAYTLQEMLTVKSDDVKQRERTYEAIIKGESLPKPGVPEGFRVLVKEMQSLGLKLDLYKENDEEISIKELEEQSEEGDTLSREELLRRKEQEKKETEEFERRKAEERLAELERKENELIGISEEVLEEEDLDKSSGMEIVDEEELDN